MTEVSRQTAKEARVKLQKALDDAFNGDSKASVLTGKYDPIDNIVEFKVEIQYGTKKTYNEDDEYIKHGLAKRGTRVRFFDGRKATVIKARRTRYLVEFDDKPGVEMVAPFKGFTALKEEEDK